MAKEYINNADAARLYGELRENDSHSQQTWYAFRQTPYGKDLFKEGILRDGKLWPKDANTYRDGRVIWFDRAAVVEAANYDKKMAA